MRRARPNRRAGCWFGDLRQSSGANAVQAMTWKHRRSCGDVKGEAQPGNPEGESTDALHEVGRFRSSGEVR
jgi:hypothetical protein